MSKAEKFLKDRLKSNASLEAYKTSRSILHRAVFPMA